jgi:hypothetical protein
VHKHVHLSLIYGSLESPHVLRRNRLYWSISHLLLTGLHLSGIIIVLLRSSLLSRHAKDKTVRRATLIMPHIPELRLRSDWIFLVMIVRMVSMNWQRLHASILWRHHRSLGGSLCGCVVRMSISRLLTLLYPGGLSRRSTVKVWHLCLYLLVAILWWCWYGHSLGLFFSIIVIVKIVQALLTCWSYRGGMRSGEVLRCGSMWRLETRSWLLQRRTKDPCWRLMHHRKCGLRRRHGGWDDRRLHDFGLMCGDLTLSTRSCRACTP